MQIFLLQLIASLYKYPKFIMYVLHNLHGQHLGLQFFIFLKAAREADSISFGTCDQIFVRSYVKD